MTGRLPLLIQTPSGNFLLLAPVLGLFFHDGVFGYG